MVGLVKGTRSLPAIIVAMNDMLCEKAYGHHNGGYRAEEKIISRYYAAPPGKMFVFLILSTTLHFKEITRHG